MIYQLRGKEEKTVCDIEVYHDTTANCIELISSVFIEGYSKLLLKHLDKSDEVVQDFIEVEEMRGWLWESYLHNNNVYSDQNMENVEKHITEVLNNLAKKYDLWLYED